MGKFIEKLKGIIKGQENFTRGMILSFWGKSAIPVVGYPQTTMQVVPDTDYSLTGEKKEDSKSIQSEFEAMIREASKNFNLSDGLTMRDHSLEKSCSTKVSYGKEFE